MTYLINYWFGSGFASTAPVFRSHNAETFLREVERIKRERAIMNSRLIEWPDLIVWAFADTKDGFNGMEENKPIFTPVRMETRA